MAYETLEVKDAIAMDDRNQVLCTHSKDFIEGVTAFLQKRAPRYQDA